MHRVICVNNCPTRCNNIQFIFTCNCCTRFGWYSYPSSGAHNTERDWMGTAAPIQPRSRRVAVTVSLMPDTVDTVLWAPDDGWRYQPKNVEQLQIKMNCILLHLVGRLLTNIFYMSPYFHYKNFLLCLINNLIQFLIYFSTYYARICLLWPLLSLVLKILLILPPRSTVYIKLYIT